MQKCLMFVAKKAHTFDEEEKMQNRIKKICVVLIFLSGLVFFLLHLIGVRVYHDPQNPGSLPWKWYLLLPLHKPFRTEIGAGDYIAFRTDKRMLPYYAPGVVFGKRVIGEPGDRLETKGRDFYLNGRFIAHAREKDSLGNPAPLFVYNGIIPENCYFTLGHHPHSFDSRYWGFVCRPAILGRLIPLGGRKY